jgi:flavoprotein
VDNGLICISVFPSKPDAEVACGLLRTGGIDAALDESAQELAAVGRYVGLLVREEDVEKARHLLKQKKPM